VTSTKPVSVSVFKRADVVEGDGPHQGTGRGEQL
jgi:hypothetical protein